MKALAWFLGFMVLISGAMSAMVRLPEAPVLLALGVGMLVMCAIHEWGDA